jgi:hypothetical protein
MENLEILDFRHAGTGRVQARNFWQSFRNIEKCFHALRLSKLITKRKVQLNIYATFKIIEQAY